jgi:hypothetical protein
MTSATRVMEVRVMAKIRRRDMLESMCDMATSHRITVTIMPSYVNLSISKTAASRHPVELTAFKPPSSGPEAIIMALL